MKAIPLIFAIMLLMACNSTSKETSFTGSWKLVKSNGVHFNILPTIVLEEIERTIPSEKASEISNSYRSQVVFAHKNTENYFSETTFQYHVTYEDDVEFLELFSIDTKNSYLLAREITP